MDMVFQKTRELGEALHGQRNLSAHEGGRGQGHAESGGRSGDGAICWRSANSIQELMKQPNPDPGALKRLSDEMDEIQERLQMMDDIVELTQARAEFTSLINQVNQVLAVHRHRPDGREENCVRRAARPAAAMPLIEIITKDKRGERHGSCRP